MLVYGDAWKSAATAADAWCVLGLKALNNHRYNYSELLAHVHFVTSNQYLETGS